MRIFPVVPKSWLLKMKWMNVKGRVDESTWSAKKMI